MKTLPMVTAMALLSFATARAQETAAPAPAEASPDSSSSSAAKVIQADDSASLLASVGSAVVVEGAVKAVGKTSGGGITFINFGDRKTGFVAVVFHSAYDKFPEGFDKYANQKVRVKGTLEKYRDGQIQIKVNTPDQLEIVPATP